MFAEGALVNRTDRLYALVEELRRAAPGARSARALAEHFEVSVRTVERDIGALQQSGVPIWAVTGRRGGYALDPAFTLPPLNFTAEEAVAVAVGLGQLEASPFATAAHAALGKLLAAMPRASLDRARVRAESVRLVGARPPAPGIADVLRDAVAARVVVKLDYEDVSGVATTREVEPDLLVWGPHGWYLTGWCRLRRDTRAFRLDRVRRAVATDEAVVARDRDGDGPTAPGFVVRTPALV